MAIFTRFARFYNHILNRHKYPVQIVSGGLLWFTGDLLSQTIVLQLQRKENEKKRKIDSKPQLSSDSYDWKRVLIMTCYGMCISAPAFAFWYTYLDKVTSRIFANSKPASSTGKRVWQIIGFKMFADVCLFDPLYLSLFFTATNVIEGQDGPHILEKLKKEFGSTYLADIVVWSPIQIINFRFIPVIYQPLLVQSVNVGWNAYLSFVQHKPLHQ